MRNIRLIYRKFDQSLHWHMTMRHLGEDEYGMWVGMPPGGSMRKGEQPPVILPCSHVVLLPHEGWWTAWFNGKPHDLEVYCDIIAPPLWSSTDTVEMVDLDLDVVRKSEGRAVSIVDRDEFLENRVRYSYPTEVVDQATATAEWLCGALADGTEPFQTTYQGWVAQLTA